MTSMIRLSSRRVPTRRMAFDEALAQVPKHFAADGDLINSHLVASLSAVFPDGEDYFVRSVRQYRDEITDPELKQQVTGFIGQEAMHGREHRAFNNRLAQLGYPTKEVEWVVKKFLALRSRVLPRAHNLAGTAALEHFTATLAEFVLTDEQARADVGDDAVQNLFVWHALEESEHKSVAFDVYKAVDGREWVRVLNMNLFTVGFFAGMIVQMIVSLLGDRATFRRGALRASWTRFRHSGLLSKELWDQLRDYNRKDFHPDDRDTTELVERWRAELFGSNGRLNNLLVSRG
jgi:predicted metal-dependent hydrolase